MNSKLLNMRVPDEIRKKLKKPIGKVFQIKDIVSKYKNKKIIAIGDIVTLSLFENGIKPFISVYDFKSMRKDIGKEKCKKITKLYPYSSVAENQPGHITRDLEEKANYLIKNGGALFIKGEEDLSALVFMRIAPTGWILVYGQPNKGVVAIECSEKTRKKAEKILQNIKMSAQGSAQGG